MEKIQLDVVMPDRVLYSGLVEMVTVPGSEGEAGVLAKHAPFITLLKEGDVQIFENGIVINRIPITGGVAEVIESRVAVLVDPVVAI